MKDIYVVCENMAINGRKMAIFETKIFNFFSSNIEKHTCQFFFMIYGIDFDPIGI